MRETIRFSNFIIRKNSFSCFVNSSKRSKTDRLEFLLDKKVKRLNRDAIACALATLCGNGYEEITMDIPVSASCCEELEKFTKAKIHTRTEKTLFCLSHLFPTAKREKQEEKCILNFSGGFDSLAALALIPEENCELVSVDFGGWFSREAKFFKSFDPHVLQTNFRQLGYDRESWTFMGTGALLYADSLRAKYHIFGTILEGTEYHFRDFRPRTSCLRRLPFSLVGLDEIQLLSGITEVGTAMIVTEYYPEKVSDSMISLAAPKSEKRFRKQMLTEIVCQRYNKNVELPDCPEPDSKCITPFGRNFALDFLAIYELKHRGLEIVRKTVSDVPEDVVALSNELNLDFYERLNPKFLNTIPETMRQFYLERLERCGIIPYTELDWEEFEKVRQCLGKYHPGILK